MFCRVWRRLCSSDRHKPALRVVARQAGVPMEYERRRVLREALQRVSHRMGARRYHPEKHYMRGPGPKTLAKLGEMLRAETEDLTRVSIPAQ
jgi:hypothetical protein